jgi:hypothetical protein
MPDLTLSRSLLDKQGRRYPIDLTFIKLVMAMHGFTRREDPLCTHSTLTLQPAVVEADKLYHYSAGS